MIIPSIEESSNPYSGLLINIEVDTLTRGDGKTFTREVARVTDVVAIAAIDSQDRILLVKQYRHSMRHAVWEIPAGRLDVEGETPLQAAARELREEADILAESLEPLSVFGNSVGWTT